MYPVSTLSLGVGARIKISDGLLVFLCEINAVNEVQYHKIAGRSAFYLINPLDTDLKYFISIILLGLAPAEFGS